MSVTNVLCGDPRPDGFWVRARVTGSSGRLLVSTTPNVADAREVASGATGPASVLSLRATGLPPATKHWWWVDSGGLDPVPGTATTAPRPGQAADLLLWVAGCSAGATEGPTGTSSNSVAFDTVRSHGAHVGMHLGDIHYWNIAENDPRLFHDAYDVCLANPRQQALFKSAPMTLVWDDHDFGPNDSDAASPSRAASVQAYKERIPHAQLLADDGTIGQTYVWGRTRVVHLDCRAGRVPGSTMLGAAQKAAFKALVDSFTERVMVLSVQVPWIAASGADTWAGYAAERLELSQLLVDSGKADRVFMVGGDMHANALDDGRNNTYGGLRRPVLQSGGIDSAGSSKGGPYSAGAPDSRRGTYGLVRVTDSGAGPIRVRLEGRKEA